MITLAVSTDPFFRPVRVRRREPSACTMITASDSASRFSRSVKAVSVLLEGGMVMEVWEFGPFWGGAARPFCFRVGSVRHCSRQRYAPFGRLQLRRSTVVGNQSPAGHP